MPDDPLKSTLSSRTTGVHDTIQEEDRGRRRDVIWLLLLLFLLVIPALVFAPTLLDPARRSALFDSLRSTLRGISTETPSDNNNAAGGANPADGSESDGGGSNPAGGDAGSGNEPGGDAASGGAGQPAAEDPSCDECSLEEVEFAGAGTEEPLPPDDEVRFGGGGGDGTPQGGAAGAGAASPACGSPCTSSTQCGSLTCVSGVCWAADVCGPTPEPPVIVTEPPVSGLCVDNGGIQWQGEVCVCAGFVDVVTVCQDGAKTDTQSDVPCTPDPVLCAAASDPGPGSPPQSGSGSSGGGSSDPVCGNGIVEAGEQCDSSNSGCPPLAVCTSSCTCFEIP